MRKIFGLIILLTGLFMVYFLSTPQRISGKPIPPLGKLLNPYSGAWQNVDKVEDYTDFELKSEHITDEVKIVFDDRMVPHIFAQNLKDALFAQGYVRRITVYFRWICLLAHLAGLSLRYSDLIC
jgi:penicillin amidase